MSHIKMPKQLDVLLEENIVHIKEKINDYNIVWFKKHNLRYFKLIMSDTYFKILFENFREFFENDGVYLKHSFVFFYKAIEFTIECRVNIFRYVTIDDNTIVYTLNNLQVDGHDDFFDILASYFDDVSFATIDNELDEYVFTKINLNKTEKLQNERLEKEEQTNIHSLFYCLDKEVYDKIVKNNKNIKTKKINNNTYLTTIRFMVKSTQFVIKIKSNDMDINFGLMNNELLYITGRKLLFFKTSEEFVNLLALSFYYKELNNVT